MSNQNYNLFDLGFDPWLSKPGLTPLETLSSLTSVSSPESTTSSGSPSSLLSTPVSNPINANQLLPGELGQLIGYGKKTFTDTTDGFLMGMDTDGTYKWKMGGSTNYIDWNVTTANVLTIVGAVSISAGGTIGGFEIGADYIRDAANSFGLASTVTGASDVRFWAGDTFANRTTAPFRLTEAGVLVASSVTVTGTINATGGYIGSTTALVYEAQGINTGTTGWIRGGQTDYETGTGYFLGYNGAAYKFSIGIGGSDVDNLHWDGTNLFVNGSQIRNQDIFGDGSDGDVTISANTSLSSDMFYNNLTIQTGFTLNPNGYRIFVKGTLTLEGTGKIARNGNNGTNGNNATSTTGGLGTGGAGGAALADGSLKGALAGKDGVNGRDGVNQISTGTTNGQNGNSGNAGSNVVKSPNSNAQTGAAGGAGGSAGGSGASTGGGGGAAGTVTGTLYNKIRNVVAAYNMFDIYPESGGNPTLYAVNAAPSNGGAGSGGSGAAHAEFGPSNQSASGSTGGAGGNGSNGGIVWIAARRIVIGASAKIQANGGNGANAGTTYTSLASNTASAGGSGGSAGGHGGEGGLIIYIYSTLSNSGTIEAVGGTGGTGAAAGAKAESGGQTANAGTAGANGSTGTTGVVIALQI